MSVDPWLICLKSVVGRIRCIFIALSNFDLLDYVDQTDILHECHNSLQMVWRDESVMLDWMSIGLALSISKLFEQTCTRKAPDSSFVSVKAKHWRASLIISRCEPGIYSFLLRAWYPYGSRHHSRAVRIISIPQTHRYQPWDLWKNGCSLPSIT